MLLMLLCGGSDDYMSWINGESRRERPSPSEAPSTTKTGGNVEKSSPDYEELCNYGIITETAA